MAGEVRRYVNRVRRIAVGVAELHGELVVGRRPAVNVECPFPQDEGVLVEIESVGVVKQHFPNQTVKGVLVGSGADAASLGDAAEGMPILLEPRWIGELIGLQANFVFPVVDIGHRPPRWSAAMFPDSR